MSHILNWPRRIARADRVLLATGHGSFCLHRIHLGTDAFDRQQINLTGYLLVVAREGSAILDRANCTLLLQEGDAALVPPGRLKLTEIPRPRFTRGQTLLYLFNRRALANLIAGREGIDEVTARINLPALPFYPVRRLSAALDAHVAGGTLKSMTDLRAVFTVMLNRGAAMAYNFLKHEVFIPRLRLCLFLEDHCHGKLGASAIAPRYPQGARAFHRDCANYLGIPVEQWLFRRRIELAQAWLRHTDTTEHEVASRLGYTDLRRFRGDMKRFGRYSPLELEVLRRFSPRKNGFKEAGVPFWFPSAEARTSKMHRDNLDFLWIAMSPHRKRDLQALLRKYPDDKPARVPTPGWLTADARLDTGSDTPEDPVGLANIINLNTVEAWQIGKSPLISEQALQLAA